VSGRRSRCSPGWQSMPRGILERDADTLVAAAGVLQLSSRPLFTLRRPRTPALNSHAPIGATRRWIS